MVPRGKQGIWQQRWASQCILPAGEPTPPSSRDVGAVPLPRRAPLPPSLALCPSVLPCSSSPAPPPLHLGTFAPTSSIRWRMTQVLAAAWHRSPLPVGAGGKRLPPPLKVSHLLLPCPPTQAQHPRRCDQPRAVLTLAWGHRDLSRAASGLLHGPWGLLLSPSSLHPPCPVAPPSP